MKPGVSVELRFAAPPPLWPAYLRAALSRKPALAREGTMPAIGAQVQVRAHPAALAAYRAVCGCPDDGHLPLAYPHVLAMPAHLAMLTSSIFPVRLPGLVHVANTITRERPIFADETLELDCRLPGMRETGRGQEFDLHTEARSGGELVWREVSTYLARRPRAGVGSDKGGTSGASPKAAVHPAQPSLRLWAAPADIGRRYARVSGDRNPVHLFNLTARLFGFPRAIAHGMWSMACSAAHLEAGAGRRLAMLEVVFKRPVMLPAQLRLTSWEAADGRACLLADAQSETPYMSGRYALGSGHPPPMTP
jgi:acyl dehydratase